MSVQQTSLEAYAQVLPQLPERRRQVLQVFIGNPYRDFTNLEVARELGWDINRVTPRVLELREMGLLEFSCQRSCRITGNTAMAWRLMR